MAIYWKSKLCVSTKSPDLEQLYNVAGLMDPNFPLFLTWSPTAIHI